MNPLHKSSLWKILDRYLFMIHFSAKIPEELNQIEVIRDEILEFIDSLKVTGCRSIYNY